MLFRSWTVKHKMVAACKRAMCFCCLFLTSEDSRSKQRDVTRVLRDVNKLGVEVGGESNDRSACFATICESSRTFVRARELAAAAHVSPEAAHLVAFEHEPRFMFPSLRKDQISHDLCIIVFMNITCGTNP